MTGPTDNERPSLWGASSPPDPPTQGDPSADPPGWGQSGQGGQPEYQPTRPYGDMPPPQRESTTQQSWPGQPTAESGAQWPTQQLTTSPQDPSYAQNGPQPYGEPGAGWQPQQYGGDPGAPWGGYQGGPQQGHPPHKKRNSKVLFAIIGAVVAIALVGGGLYFFLSGEDITYEGREIVEPEQVLISAEQTLDGIVGERNGTSNDDTACYFVAKNADTTDIENGLACGPVLFVDGDDTQPYLSFAIEASGGDGDASLTVAAEPDSPDPAALANPELLLRPDGGTPPEGSGGLAAPDPPRAEAGVFTVIPLEGLELEATDSNARIGSPTMSVAVSGIGEPERYGQGDDARRPAEGEKFVAFEIASGPGEFGPAGGYSIAVQSGEEDPIPLPDDAELSGDPAALAISVPEDTEDVSLVVTEGDLVQRLSLTTGEPDPGNIAVWQRENRTQSLAFTQGLTVRASQTGFVAEDLPCTVSVSQVDLAYFGGPNGDRAPSTPGQAFLLVGSLVDLDGQLGQFDPVFWSLTLPDGTVLPAGDLNDDPELIEIAIEVPASFTEGTLGFGGVSTDPDGLTFDTLGVFAQIPVSISAG